MSSFERFTYVLGSIILWGLIALAAIVLVTFIPVNSAALQGSYLEFSNDTLTIQTLLSVPVLIGQLILFEVMYLIRLVHRNQMFTNRAFKWVRALTISAFALAGSIGFIAIWLASKNTLPPFVAMFLAVTFLLVLAVALVVISLLGLLKRATEASQELEGVI
jgi:hypothetical protein